MKTTIPTLIKPALSIFLSLSHNAFAASLFPIPYSQEPRATTVSTNDDVIMNTTNNGTGTWTTKRATVAAVAAAVSPLIGSSGLDASTTNAWRQDATNAAAAAASALPPTLDTNSATSLPYLISRDPIGLDEWVNLEPTPPLCVHTWQIFGLQCTESNILTLATNMVAFGYPAYGWKTIMIDEGWEARVGGHLVGNSNYPSGMGTLITNLHRMGLKGRKFMTLGLTTLDGGYPGSQGYEEIDAADTANEGWDSVFIVNDLNADNNVAVESSFRKFVHALHTNGVPVYVMGSLHYSIVAPWMANGLNTWMVVQHLPPGITIGGSTGTMDGGIYDNIPLGWTNWYALIDGNYLLRGNVRKGHYLNNSSMGGTTMTYGYQNEVGMNALMSAEMVAFSLPGSDAPYITSCQTNRTILSIHQDPAVIPAEMVGVRSNVYLYVKPLGSHSGTRKAFGLQNRSDTTAYAAVGSCADFGIASNAPILLTDAWAQTNCVVSNGWAVVVQPRELKLYITEPAPTAGIGVTTTILDAATNSWVFNQGVLVSVTPFQPPAITNGLVGWWKFDEGSGTTANDSSTNGNTGTLLSTLVWTNSSGTEGVYWTGYTGQRVDLPNTASLNISGNCTLLAWVNPSIVTNSEEIIGGFQNSGSYPGYGLGIFTSGNLRAYANGAWSFGTATVTNLGRVLVGVAYGGTTNVFYVNGAVDKINTGIAQPNAWSGVRAIGAMEGGTYEFTGVMDNVRIYNRVLGPDEILYIYNTEK